MRLHLPRAPTSPLPHADDPPPLIQSPASVLGLTASQQRRRRNFVRASSSEPTVAGGLANWRRQPKTKGSGTETATTGSVGTSETKRAKKGAGMGMQGTPAKKGKRSNSRSMGVHSTPAAKIRSRTQSISQAQDVTGAVAVNAESSESSIHSLLPGSADFETPSPPSQIPDLSSPSVPAIPTFSRKWDVFDGAYVPTPKERTSEEREDFDRLIGDAEEEPSDEQPPEEEEMEEEEMDGLYGWKEDVLWSLRGSTESGVDLLSEAQDLGDQQEATIPEQTIYHDVLVSINDNTEQSTSPSSRTKRRSSNIQNRQPTPHRRSAESSGHSTARKARADAGPHNLDSSSAEDDTFYTARTSRAPLARSSSEEERGNGTTAPAPLPRGASPDKSPASSLPHPAQGGAETDQEALSTLTSHSGPAVPIDTQGSEQRSQSALSALLEYTNPVPPDVTLSQLLKSTQSAGGTQKNGADADIDDEPVEVGRGRMTPLSDHGNEPAQARSDSPATPLPMFDGSDVSFQRDYMPSPSFGGDEAPYYPPENNDQPGYEWKLGRSGLPTPFTPSSHLSPCSVQTPLSPISFATTRSPSVQPRVTPPPTRQRSKKRKTKLVRKGAWKGAEVLARMEEADRGTAKYHTAFDMASPGAADEEEEGAVSTGRKKRERRIAAEFEESDEVLIARRRRIAHYEELEVGYELHVELVF